MSSLLWPQDVESFDTDDSNAESSGPCYTLKAYIPDQHVTLPVKALLDSIITTSSYGNSQVFHAELRIVADGGLTDHDHGGDVVCKVAYGQRQIDVLRKEADFYSTKLRHLQGTVVPLMYGCYIDDTDEGPTGVLVLQDCGIPLEYKLKYYKLELRLQAVHALLAIHKAGVQHNDFYERNILASKGENGSTRVTVIDFGRAKDHTCRLTGVDTITPYEPTPDEYHFPCPELHAVCWERADVWRPKYVLLFGHLVPLEHATSVDSLLQHVSVPEDMADRARDRAQSAINRVKQVMKRRKALDDDPFVVVWD